MGADFVAGNEWIWIASPAPRTICNRSLRSLDHPSAPHMWHWPLGDVGEVVPGQLTCAAVRTGLLLI
eukprot:SAG31_NODE_1507_length_8072_cov_7.986580_2_plen_67_part_00